MNVYFVCPDCKRYTKQELAWCMGETRGLCHHADGKVFMMIACKDRREATTYLAAA